MRASLGQERSPDIDEGLRDPADAFSGGDPPSCIMPCFVDRRSEQHCGPAGHALAEIDERAHLRLFEAGSVRESEITRLQGRTGCAGYHDGENSSHAPPPNVVT